MKHYDFMLEEDEAKFLLEILRNVEAASRQQGDFNTANKLQPLLNYIEQIVDPKF